MEKNKIYETADKIYNVIAGKGIKVEKVETEKGMAFMRYLKK
ncbi:hypothetical protein [Scopulibacillus cellulosilyticus]|uniref:Uncharacterized protein n=1 Tax=Scopulibacillus cellulosilyticus TaxID=2665665 RepID=A0ABW2Q1X3_9BACL